MRALTERPSASEVSVTLTKFGMKRRLVLMLEWLTLWPTKGFLPVNSQRQAMAKILVKSPARRPAPVRDRHARDCRSGRIESPKSAVKPRIFTAFRRSRGAPGITDSTYSTPDMRRPRAAGDGPCAAKYGIHLMFGARPRSSPRQRRAGGSGVVRVFRPFLATVCMGLCGLALAALAPAGARAQGKLDAHYEVTLAGIPIGKGSWVVEIGETQYSASAGGVTTGLIRVFVGGE